MTLWVSSNELPCWIATGYNAPMIFPALVAALVSETSPRPRARAQELRGRVGIRDRVGPAGLRARLDHIEVHQPLAYPYIVMTLLSRALVPDSAFEEPDKVVSYKHAPDNPFRAAPKLRSEYHNPALGRIFAWLAHKIQADQASAVAGLLYSRLYGYASDNAVDNLGEMLDEEIAEMGGYVHSYLGSVPESARYDYATEHEHPWMEYRRDVLEDDRYINSIRYMGEAQLLYQPDGTLVVTAGRQGPSITLRYAVNVVDADTLTDSNCWRISSIDGIDTEYSRSLSKRIRFGGGIRPGDHLEDLPVEDVVEAFMAPNSPLQQVPLIPAGHDGARKLSNFGVITDSAQRLSAGEQDIVLQWLILSADTGLWRTRSVVAEIDRFIERATAAMAGGVDVFGEDTVEDACVEAIHGNALPYLREMEEDLEGGNFPVGGGGARWKQTPGLAPRQPIPLDEEAERIIEWPDGSVVVELKDQKRLSDEGAVMNHCVGIHSDLVEGGARRVFSLRVPSGDPGLYISRATVEVSDSSDAKVFDLKAVGNTSVRNELDLARMLALLWLLRGRSPEDAWEADEAFLRQHFSGDEWHLLSLRGEPSLSGALATGLDGAIYTTGSSR